MASSPDLRVAQGIVSELIRATDGVEQTLAREGTRSRDLRDQLRATVKSDARLDAVHRLEVYANAYFYRILDCLREDFPALARFLGETAFHDLITAYLRAHPSDSFSMRYVGRRLPGFLRSEPGAAWARERHPWAPDLALLEWSFLDAFDAPDAPVARREDLAQVPPESFAELQFWLDPSVQRLEIDARALRLKRTATADDPPDLERVEGTEHLLVWRREERVTSRVISSDEALALAALAQGLTFGEICVRVAVHLGEEAAPGAVATWLAGWIDAGCLARSEAPIA